MQHLLVVSAFLATTADAPAAPPTLRLPGDVRPLRQTVELTIDPSVEAFAGTIDVQLDVTRDTSLLWLNATGLTILSARLGPEGQLRPARVVAAGDDFVGFALETPLPKGQARLAASFEGRVSRVQNEGLFAMKEGEEWYAFTQFEATSARRAFPCFDEPSYKIPWEVTLRVPHGQRGLSNAPVVSTLQDGDHDVIRFAPTPPLPSYLVAVAVGPFDMVDLGALGRAATPARLVVPKGRGGDTAWARASTPRLLELLEDYFDRPYPYAKLDQVAIPGVGFAMEHPGLVTYGMSVMVQRPKEESIVMRRAWTSVCAHELAHQWFGDLVTMAWWDDIWLNESFASWMGEKVSERFRPDWGIPTQRVAARSGALESDVLASARRIRQPIESKDDITNAFDGITYAKGQAVLEMVEAWLGEDVFRRGVQAHLQRHAWGNATASDFLSALSSAAGRDVSTMLSTYLEQTGAPIVSAQAICEGAPRLILRQRPYAALGSRVAPKRWQVPVCVKAASREGSPGCLLLTQEAGELALDGAACPDWIYANAGATGYYRTLVDAAGAHRALASGKLSAVERVALAGDLDALVASGDLPAGDALGLLPFLGQDAERQVVLSGVGLARGLEPAVDAALLPLYQAFVRSVFGAGARQMGFSSRPDESEDARLLRRSLIAVAGDLGGDPDLKKEALALLRRWLDDPSSIDPDMVDPVLSLGMASADRPLVERLAAEVRSSGDRERRQHLFGALGSLRDSSLAGEALALLLDERLDAREAVYMLWALGWHRETRRTAFDFLKSHYDALARRLPTGAFSPATYLPWVAAGLCTSDARQEIEAFFRPRAASVEGGPRILNQVLESVDQCVARTEVEQPSIAAFLKQ